MGEGQVSVEGRTSALDELFFVIATQNPVEFRGTYPLPEAQMDRFAIRLSLGYVDAETEAAIVQAQERAHPLASIASVISPGEVNALRLAVREVRVSAVVQRYIVDLVRATRSAPGVQLGAGPRASIALTRLAQALALIEGVAFVAPEHVRELAVAVIAHRLVLDPQAKFAGTTAQGIVADILGATPVPA
jgi:MoxR-like ATPase